MAKAKQTGRGAKAPHSAFRGATKDAKPAKKAEPKKPTPKKPTPKKPTPKKPAPKKAVPAKAKQATPLAAREQLGEITVPSGQLALFDVGLFGFLPRPALEPAIITVAAPSDRPLAVVGQRLGVGRFAACWDHVAVELGEGRITAAHRLGEAGVDFARLLAIDHAALDHWQHEDSLDGKADVVFWGRDDGELARAMNAGRLAEGWGWLNLTTAQAEAKADDAARRKATARLLLTIEHRPHSHHHAALAALRASPSGSGAVEVGGSRACLFATSWGEGVFPVYLDVDGDGTPVRVRVQLHTPASLATMRAAHG
jgi:hypothetical protein